MSVFWPAAVNLFVRAVPAHLMAYYPFRARLRFPLWRVLLPVGLLQIAQALLYGWMVQGGGDGKGVEYGFALVYMGLYFFSVRDNRCKLLFLYLFVMDYVMILRGASAFLEARFFYHPGMDFQSWRSTLFGLGVLAVSAPFTLRFFASAMEKVFNTDAPAFWRTAWLVPAFTTAIVMIFTSNLTAERVRSFQFLFARVLLLLCVFVFYYILLDALDAIRRQAALAEQSAMQEQLLNLERAQHEQLIRHMAEIKSARHDLRQHLGVIRAYLEDGNLDGLKAYLHAYERELPADIGKTFAKNFALNAVCVHYAEEAQKYKIDYDVILNIPEQIPVNEPAVCALLGNLLENAVEACRKVRHTTPFIKVRGMCEGRHIVLTVDNSCEQEPVWENGRLRSSKREGLGTGTWMVRRTAEHSGGTAEFSCENGVFFASVLLYHQTT